MNEAVKAQRAVTRFPWLPLTLLVGGGLLVIGIIAFGSAYELYAPATRNAAIDELLVSAVSGVAVGLVLSAAMLVLLTRHWVFGLCLVLGCGLLGRGAWCIAWDAGERAALFAENGMGTVYSVTYSGGPTAWDVLCILPICCFAICSPLILARSWFGWQLTAGTIKRQPSKNGLEDIFVGMTLIASFIALVRVTSQVHEVDSFSFWPPMLIAIAALFGIGLPLIVAVLVTWPRVSRPEQTIALQLFSSTLAFAVGISSAFVMLVSIGGGPIGPKLLQAAATGAFATAVTLTLCLYFLRRMGFRRARGGALLPKNVDGQAAMDQATFTNRAERADEVPAETAEELADAEELVDGRSEGYATAATERPLLVADQPSEQTAPSGNAVWWPRLAAGAIVATCCVASAIGGRVESDRVSHRQFWNAYVQNESNIGAAVEISENELVGLKVAQGATDQEVAALLRPSLTSLSLAGANVSDDLLKQVSELSDLAYLDMSQTSIGDEGLHHLEPHLHFAYLGVGATEISARALTRFLKTRSANVLDLTDSAFTDKEIKLICTDRVWGIVLTGTQASDALLLQLTNFSLTHIDVSGTAIRGDFLTQLHSGVELVLDSTPITDATLAKVPSGVQFASLSIRDTAITLKGIQPLLGRIGKLTIGEGPITDSEIAAICFAVPSVKIDRPKFDGHNLKLGAAATMLQLDVSGTQFDDQGMQVLRQGGVEVGTLILADTKVTDACLADLSAMHPNEIDVSRTAITAEALLTIADDFHLFNLRIALGQYSDSELKRLKSQFGFVTIGKVDF